MFFCTGFPEEWTLKEIKSLIETKFRSRVARCTLKHNPQLPNERGFFFTLAKRVSFSRVCKTHALGEDGQHKLIVVRTRDAFPEFFASKTKPDAEEVEEEEEEKES